MPKHAKIKLHPRLVGRFDATQHRNKEKENKQKAGISVLLDAVGFRFLI